MLAHRHLLDQFLHGENLLRRQDLRDLEGVGAGGSFDDGQLLLARRVIHLNLEHEPVKLGFGQWIGAFLLDRVLRGQHQKWVGQRIGLAADRQLPFLGGLQQRALGFWRRAVNFVGEDQVAEERPRHEAEHAFAGGVVLLQNIRARDVGGHQVRRELDAAEGLS